MSEQPEVVEAAPAAEVVPAEQHVAPVVHRVETPDEAKWRVLKRIADSVASTEFVPRAYRDRPLAVLACLAYGRELGLGEMQSLQSINVIEGKPTLAPEAMRAIVRRAGHKIETMAYTDDVVTLQGTRSDGSAEVVSFTMDDARRAGLVRQGSAWQKYPRAMLSARATSELCRLLFSDVIMGASYVPEEMSALSDSPPPDGDFVEYEERREPPIKIMQSDPQHAGRAVKSAAGTQPGGGAAGSEGRTSPAPPAPFNWHTIVSPFGGEVKVCNECAHFVVAHSTIRRGCTECACKNTWPEFEAEARGVASPDQGEGSAAAVAVNDGRNPVEAEPPPPEPSDDENGPPPARVGDPSSSAQADPTQQAEEAGPLPNPASEAQFRRIHASLKDNDLGDEARHCIISFVTGMRTTSSRELTADEATVVLNLIGQVRLGRLSVEVHDGTWGVLAVDDAGVKFLRQVERRVQPARGRYTYEREQASEVQPLSEDERAGAI